MSAQISSKRSCLNQSVTADRSYETAFPFARSDLAHIARNDNFAGLTCADAHAVA